MRERFQRALAIVLCAALTGGTAPARPLPDAPATGSWDKVMAVAPGQCVRVSAQDGREWRGKMVSASVTGIRISLGKQEVLSLPFAEIEQVDQYKRCSSSRAAWLSGLAGFAVGFGAMAIGANALCPDCEDNKTGLLAALGVGAVAGLLSAWLGARSTDQPLVVLYRRT